MADELTKWMQCAEADLEGGVYSIPLEWGQKHPINREWQTLRLGPSEFSEHLESVCNRGRLLGIAPPEGAEGGWVICVDLDSVEALRLAKYFLPVTGEIAGRPSKRFAHYFFECESPPKTRRFRDTSNNTILDLLSIGSQVVVEPSIHPSGEPYQWDALGKRGCVKALPITFASSLLAVVCLFIVSSKTIEEFDVLCSQLDGQIEDLAHQRLLEAVSSLRLQGPRVLCSLVESPKRDGSLLVDTHDEQSLNRIVHRAVGWLR